MMRTATETSLHSSRAATTSPLSFLWLEITSKCNLQCVHCYADSGPGGGHGLMTSTRWKEIILEARDLGTQTVQFIGGEPTLHPQFPELVRHAASVGLSVEVYTNLTRVPSPMWEMFEECSVSIATSFYSSDPEVHNRVTTRHRSQERTLTNIQEALERNIPLRVGIVDVLSAQDILETQERLRSLGVKDVGVDRMRGVGRGVVGDGRGQSVDALCGACGSRNAAIDSEGWVYPCVFSRWLRVGKVLTERLEDVIRGECMTRTKRELNAEFARRGNGPDEQEKVLLRSDPTRHSDCAPSFMPCGPNPPCSPITNCSPINCSPITRPCNPIVAPPPPQPPQPCHPMCNPTCNPICMPGMCQPATGRP